MPNNQPESLSAILSEMRLDADILVFPTLTPDKLRTYADRIEAAAKRKWDACCKICEAKSANINQLLVERDRAIKARVAAKWLYRLEYHDGTCGLWYDGSGNWCFERGIGSLDDSCKTKSLPMDYDERYRQDGRSWFSSCSRKEDLLHWYSREDAKRLLSHGFVFTRYLATEYREYDQQTVFIKETCLYREEIDFESLWKSSSSGNAAAMRGLLERIRHEYGWGLIGCRTCVSSEADVERVSDLFEKQIDAALSAPCRNCDRFATAEEARMAFEEEHSREIVHNLYTAAFDWLFAPAKGGDNA